MTPRELQKAMREGRYTSGVRPKIPNGWPDWKRRRMAIYMRCAMLFVIHRKRWHEIIDHAESDWFPKGGATRARVQQCVAIGVAYMLKTDVFVPVKRKRSE